MLESVVWCCQLCRHPQRLSLLSAHAPMPAKRMPGAISLCSVLPAVRWTLCTGRVNCHKQTNGTELKKGHCCAQQRHSRGMVVYATGRPCLVSPKSDMIVPTPPGDLQACPSRLLNFSLILLSWQDVRAYPGQRDRALQLRQLQCLRRIPRGGASSCGGSWESLQAWLCCGSNVPTSPRLGHAGMSGITCVHGANILIAHS